MERAAMVARSKHRMADVINVRRTMALIVQRPAWPPIAAIIISATDGKVNCSFPLGHERLQIVANTW